MKWLPPVEVARRRIIEDFSISWAGRSGKGKIVCDGRSFEFTFEDVLDIAQLCETLSLRLVGKLLRPKFRPAVKNRAPCRPTRVTGGDYSLYDGKDQPLPPTTVCDVTGHVVKTHYLRVEIGDEVWDSFFGRLDELTKCVYRIVADTQGEKEAPKPSLFIGARGPIPFEAPGSGNA